jgi:hypothetical protein
MKRHATCYEHEGIGRRVWVHGIRRVEVCGVKIPESVWCENARRWIGGNTQKIRGMKTSEMKVRSQIVKK